MKDLMQKIQAQALSSRPCYLVALIESEGSTPRTSGAYMLVGEKGLLYGTIGGGGMEYAAQQLAQQRLRCGGGSFVKTFDLSPAARHGLRWKLSGAVLLPACGGRNGGLGRGSS